MILSVDFGTSSLKLAVLDAVSLDALHEGHAPYDYHLLSGEKVEMDPRDLYGALRKACMGIPDEMRNKIERICYDTFSPSLMLLDRDGEPLHPVVTHMDRRSRVQSEYICEVMGADAYRDIAGVYPFTGGVSLTTLLWFMQNEPDLCKLVGRIGHLTTWVHKKLTGVWMTDFVNASMMGIYDTVFQSGWSSEIIRAFGLNEEWLCPVELPGASGGGLLPDQAEMLGLVAGIPVMFGTNDAMASQYAVGNTESGSILNISGSSDMVSILTNRPALNARYYVRNAARPGQWQIYATTCGGFGVDWFREQFCREMSKDEFFGNYLPKCCEIAAEMSDAPDPDRAGDIGFLPYLAEDRQSLEHRKAAWTGLSLATSRDEMLAALLFSMQEVLRDVVDLAAREIALIPEIKVMGGFGGDAVAKLKEKVFRGYAVGRTGAVTLLGNALMPSRMK
jgi:sugar (pentulose or hexulose) kinase